MPNAHLWPALISLLMASAAMLLVFAVSMMLSDRHLRERSTAVRRPSLDPASWLMAVPVPSWLATRLRGEDLELRLKHAGLRWPAQAFIGLRYLALMAGAGSAGAILFVGRGELLPATFSGALILTSLVLPDAVLNLRNERRRAVVDRALPDLIDRLTLGLEAGLGFEVALRRTASRFRGLLGKEIRKAVRMMDRGRPRSEVMDRLADRSSSQNLRAFSASIRQSVQLGTPLSKTLRVQSKLLRSHRHRRAQEASRRIPILIVFPLVFLFLPALLIIYLAPPLLHLFLGR